MRDRAFRRDRLAKQKRRAAHFYITPKDADAAWIGRLAVTPKPCSCWMCGNPRRRLGEITRQEAQAPSADEAG